MAYSSYVLAKQAKLQLAFRHVDQALPESNLYLLPSIKGANCLPRRKWLELVERVRKGATLYMSLDDGILMNFEQIAGVEVIRRAKHGAAYSMAMNDGRTLEIGPCDELSIRPITATVLGRRAEDDAPIFWRNHVGKGSVYVIAAPIEDQLTRLPRAFSPSGSHWLVYAEIARSLRTRRTLTDDPDIIQTLHQLDDGSTVAVLINHSATPKTVELPRGNSQNLRSLRGELRTLETGLSIKVPPYDAALLQFQRLGDD